MADPNWLTEAESRAWCGYRRMRTLLDLQVNRDLARDSGLSEPDYNVLSTLSETDGHERRLNELAELMLWSKSRLSHHLTRMQQRGLVERRECRSDGRGSVIALTVSGLRAIQEAAPLHAASVRRHFIDHLTAQQVTALGDLAQTTLDHLCRHGDGAPRPASTVD